MLRSVLVAVLALALSPAVLACQRLTGEQCAELCWRFNELHFWERFDQESAGLTPTERDALRAQRQKDWAATRAREVDHALENCVRECRSGGAPKDLACVQKASTAAQARACLESGC